jgi:hypothetical protein
MGQSPEYVISRMHKPWTVVAAILLLVAILALVLPPLVLWFVRSASVSSAPVTKAVAADTNSLGFLLKQFSLFAAERIILDTRPLSQKLCNAK